MTPTAHVLELVATYPGPRPTTDDPASQAAYAEQVLAWLRHDHPDEWRDYLAHVARDLTAGPEDARGRGTTSPPPQGTETVEASPPNRENSSRDLLPHPRRP